MTYLPAWSSPGARRAFLGPVGKVECTFGIVIPYDEHSVDVRRRPEWTTVAPLPRPVTLPPKTRQ